MVGDESIRRSAMDGRSRMSLVGQAPPCRKPDRRVQARFEALNRAGSDWEIVRETLKKPCSTESDSLSRSRPTSPSWSATRSATCGRYSTRLPISWRCSTLVRSPRMRSERRSYRSASPARSSTIGRLRRTNRRSCAARRSSKRGSGTIRSGQPFAFAERLRRSADDRGRTPLADRRRLRGTTMSASSSTGCGMFTSTDVYGCWQPCLPREGGH
jgi:hypothetical protein